MPPYLGKSQIITISCNTSIEELAKKKYNSCQIFIDDGAAMSLQVKGLSHITFVCRDIERTAKMFKGIFGAEEVYCSGDKTFSISKEKFLQVANIWIAIMQGEPIEKSYNHVAFQVNNEELDEFETKVRSLGLTVLPGRKREGAEGRSLYFYDYDNHLLELHTGDLHTRLEYYTKG